MKRRNNARGGRAGVGDNACNVARRAAPDSIEARAPPGPGRPACRRRLSPRRRGPWPPWSIAPVLTLQRPRLRRRRRSARPASGRRSRSRRRWADSAVRRLPCRRGAARAAVRARACWRIGVVFAGQRLRSRGCRCSPRAAACALPGVLLWLLRRLRAEAAARPRCRWPAQWVAAIALGAAQRRCGACAGLACPGRDAARRLPGLAAPALAGAGAGGGDVPVAAHARAGAVPAETTARLAELQSRIRPHFLFNTLNTALTLVRLDPARAEGVLEDLAELFRVALAESGDVGHAGRGGRAGAALPGDRADPLRQPPAGELGARRAAGARARAAAAAAAAGGERGAPRRRAGRRGRHDPRAHAASSWAAR